MSNFWIDVSAYSIVLPVIIGALRFKRILKSYRPFILLVSVALGNEIISDIFIKLIRNDAVNNNIYTLAEYLIIIVLFMQLDEANHKTKYYGLVAFGIIAWTVDNILLHAITDTSSYFRIIYGLVIVFLSVSKLNEVLFNEVRHTFKNAMLVICISLILEFTYQAVFEIFIVLKLPYSIAFYKKLFYILIYVNFFTNLLYALAMLWAPTKRQFTLPY
jgi:hypothetical protein